MNELWTIFQLPFMQRALVAGAARRPDEFGFGRVRRAARAVVFR